MFSPISEDYHESSQKGKPRLPKSQGVTLDSKDNFSTPRTSSTPTPTLSSSSSSSLGLKFSDSLVISNDNFINRIPNDSKETALSCQANAGSVSRSDSTDNVDIVRNLLRLELVQSSLSSSTINQPNKIHLENNRAHPLQFQSNNNVLGTANYNNYTAEARVSGKVSSRRNTAPSETSLLTSSKSDVTSFSIPSNLDISIGIASVKDYRRVAKTLLLSFEDDPFMNYILNTSQITKENTPKSAYKKKKLDLMQAYFEYDAYECISLGGTIFIVKDNSFEATLDDLGVKKYKFPYLGVALWNQIYGADCSSSGSDSDDDSGEIFASSNLRFFDNIHPSYFKFNVYSILGNCRSKVLNDKLPFLTKVRKEVLVNKLIKKPELNRNGLIDIWYLNDIATLPSMRGKGLGKILIHHSLEEFKKQNPYTYAYLESSNPNNRKFYLKLGYKVMTSFSIKYNKIVDSDKIAEIDPKNEAINMDSMLFFP